MQLICIFYKDSGVFLKNLTILDLLMFVNSDKKDKLNCMIDLQLQLRFGAAWQCWVLNSQ